jgi:hypothetical protein
MAQSPPAVASEQQSAVLPHPWRSRPFAAGVVAGIATPWGLVGLSAEYTPIEHLSLGGGVGTNLFGWQIAGMARVRFAPERRSSFYVGAGYSQGRHRQAESTRDGVLSLFTGPLTTMGHDSRREREWKTARWLDVELGIERREPQGFNVRGFIGSAFLLNPGGGAVAAPIGSDESPALPTRDVMLYAGAALGFSL